MGLPVSFEFFPPKTPEGVEKLRAVRQQLYPLKPEFCSVTYGAGGSTQEGTFNTVRDILAESVPAASHFSCIGATKASVREQLATLKAMGVKRLVALRGDLPSGYGAGGEFHYASDLVAFIRAETGDDFHIEVAAYPEVHPQAKSPRVRPECLRDQGPRRGALGHHPVLLQQRRLLPFRGRRLQARRRRAGGARHHAHHQLHAAHALLGRQRRRDPALDPSASAGVW